ncbi:MAG: heme biosynthesis protein HemY, partial [Beijerinckiaceae bacterium]|nr:heme biosynthesis protein HemY [Beijerinckiaceae bacterium]
MLRVLIYLLLLIALALGLAWLIERPGEITLNWQGHRIKTSLLVALAVLLALAAVIIGAWGILRSAMRSPSAISAAARVRRREKGFAALSQGIHAVGIGDVRLAAKAAAQVQRYLPGEPLALLLRAEAAQLAGDHQGVEAAFREMTARDDTKLLGYRGLHAHAHRHGEMESAHHFAQAAHKIAALPWTAAAVMQKCVAAKDWQGALTALEDNRNLIGKRDGELQRTILIAATALDKEHTAPDEALRLARLAARRAPDLVPAAALAARLMIRKGAVRKAARLIERAWPLAPHPELARLYLDLRPGEAHGERLARARTLMKLAPNHPESRMALASAAVAACDFKAAREAMRPLIEADERPTARMCLLMAEIEEAEHGESGYIREWLARASRAPRDACWVADGVMTDQWMPASPVTGRLGAFVWKRPDERPSASVEPAEAIFRPIAARAEPRVLIEKQQTIAIPPPAPEAHSAPGASAIGSTSQPASAAAAEEASGQGRTEGAAPGLAADEAATEGKAAPGGAHL